MSARVFYFIAFILATILSFVSAKILAHGGPVDAFVVLAFVTAFMAVIGLGAVIEAKGWA